MKRCLFAVLSFCFVVAGLFAEENSVRKISLTVDDAVELALRNHIDIQTKAISLERSRREYAHSWNNVLPSIKATGTGTENRTYKDSDTDTLSLQAGVTASLSLDLGLASKIKKLKAAYEEGKSGYEDTVRATETAVRQSFYNLLYLKEKVASAKSTLESYQRQYDQTSARAKRGMASELDLLTAQVNLETAKPDVDSAENTYLNTLVSFLNTIGMEIKVEERPFVELEGSLDYVDKAKKLDTEKIVESCVENSSEVRALEDKIRTAKFNRSATAGSLYSPSLNASASAFPFNYQNEMNYGITSNVPNWNISLGLSIPLGNYLPGSSAKDTVAALDDTIKTYQLQLENTKKNVKTSVIEKLKNIELSQRTLAARKMNLELAEKSYKMTEDAYNSGTKDLLTLQSSLDKLQTAQLQLRAEQYTLISNVLDLENTLSLPSGSLFA